MGKSAEATCLTREELTFKLYRFGFAFYMRCGLNVKELSSPGDMVESVGTRSVNEIVWL